MSGTQRRPTAKAIASRLMKLTQSVESRLFSLPRSSAPGLEAGAFVQTQGHPPAAADASKSPSTSSAVSELFDVVLTLNSALGSLVSALEIHEQRLSELERKQRDGSSKRSVPVSRGPSKVQSSSSDNLVVHTSRPFFCTGCGITFGAEYTAHNCSHPENAHFNWDRFLGENPPIGGSL